MSWENLYVVDFLKLQIHIFLITTIENKCSDLASDACAAINNC